MAAGAVAHGRLQGRFRPPQQSRLVVVSGDFGDAQTPGNLQRAVLGRPEASGGVVSHPFRQQHGIGKAGVRQKNGEAIVTIAVENVPCPQSRGQVQSRRPQGTFDGVRAVGCHQMTVMIHLHQHYGESGTAGVPLPDALLDLAAERRLIALFDEKVAGAIPDARRGGRRPGR